MLDFLLIAGFDRAEHDDQPLRFWFKRLHIVRYSTQQGDRSIMRLEANRHIGNGGLLDSQQLRILDQDRRFQSVDNRLKNPLEGDAETLQRVRKGGFYQGPIEDLVRLFEGCRMDGNLPVRRGMRFELLIMLPGKRAAIIVQEARVTWARGQEFGLRFDTLLTHEAAHLEQYIVNKIG